MKKIILTVILCLCCSNLYAGQWTSLISTVVAMVRFNNVNPNPPTPVPPPVPPVPEKIRVIQIPDPDVEIEYPISQSRPGCPSCR